MGVHRGRPAGGDGQVPRLQPRSRRTAPTRPAPPILAAPGSAAAARSPSSSGCQNLEFRLAIPQDNGYARTHPLNGERIARAREPSTRPIRPGTGRPIRRSRRASSGSAPSCPAMSTIRAGCCAAIRRATSSIPARYARAYACHRTAHPDEAMAEVDSLLAAAPHDPYFLELKGQVLLESGQPARGAGGAARGGARSRPTSR